MADNTYHVMVTCPQCGRKSDYAMETLIDATMDPKAEEKVFSGSLFTHVCPFCKEEETLTYSCLYHDGARNVLIGFADSDKDLTDFRTALNKGNHRDELDNVLNDWLARCRVRLVTSMMDLQEKVLIFHFDLDDRLVEIAKHYAKIVAEEKQPDLVIDKLMLNRNEDDYAFVVFNEDGIAGEIPFSKETYNMLKQRYETALTGEKSIEIDEKWAEAFLLKKEMRA